MKKVVLMCCAMAAMVFASCDNGENGGYQGTNYVSLSSELSTVYAVEGQELVLNVSLTAALAEDLTLEFATDAPAALAELEGSPVTIPAGEKKASFKLAVNGPLENVTSQNYSISLVTESLPEKVVWEQDYVYTVRKAVELPALTPDQQAIVDGYAAADLNKYLGYVKCTVEYTYYDMATFELCEKPMTWTTMSAIVLSEESAAGTPVLKMIANPMGMEDEMYNILKGQTINNEYWPEQPDGQTVMAGLGWSADKEEIFSMTLDGITLGADGTVEFVGELPDRYGEPYSSVPFEYYFSVYEKEKVTELDVTEDGTGTANPAFWLAPYCEIIEDEWLNEDGVFVEPSASISAESLTFEYCFDYDGAAGYNKVKVTYTPNE